MITGKDTTVFNFSDGYNEGNIWGSGVLFLPGGPNTCNCLHACAAGVPYDGVPTSRLVTVKVPLAVFYTILGALGITFAVGCLCFNFAFRKNPLVKQTCSAISCSIDSL